MNRYQAKVHKTARAFNLTHRGSIGLPFISESQAIFDNGTLTSYTVSVLRK
jgi:hypothetical protein